MNIDDEQSRHASSRQGRADERDEALLEAEVGRVMHALAPYGVLREDALARACGAGRWRAGQFESALAAAVRGGRVRRLPFGFYASADALDGAER